MKKNNNGISFIELIFLLAIIVIIALFIAPKVFYRVPDSNQIKAKETIMTIFSAYKTCRLANPETCKTIKDAIEYIQYNENNEQKQTIILPNNVTVNYTSNDKVIDGTCFTITLPDKTKSFKLYISGNNNISINEKPDKNDDFNNANINVSF